MIILKFSKEFIILDTEGDLTKITRSGTKFTKTCIPYSDMSFDLDEQARAVARTPTSEHEGRGLDDKSLAAGVSDAFRLVPGAIK